MLRHVEGTFLDDGGTVSDNDRRAPQYRAFLGEYLAPRLGGRPAQWSDANAAVIAGSMDAFDEFPLDGGYLAARRIHIIKWLRDMCDLVGVDSPADEDECAEFAIATHRHIWAQIECEIPGAADAIRQLNEMGYRLYMGSGTESIDLDATLRGMEVRELFIETYGTDLIDTWKGSRLYYDRVLAHAGVSPENALFVDDSNRCVSWAVEADAAALLIASEQPESTEAIGVLGSLAELPELLATRGG